MKLEEAFKFQQYETEILLKNQKCEYKTIRIIIKLAEVFLLQILKIIKKK